MISSELRNSLLQTCRKRFAEVLQSVAVDASVRQAALLKALKCSADIGFDELAGLKDRRDFERQRNMTASRISLVNFDDMDLTVAMINLSQKLSDRCERSLSQLHLRFMSLLGQEDAVMAQLPVGPDAACVAIRGMLDEGSLDVTTRLKLATDIEPALGRALSALYGELDDLLAKAGVEPFSLLRPSNEQKKSAATTIGKTASAMGGNLGALQATLLQRAASAGRTGAPGLDASLMAAIVDRVLGWLSERQQDPTAAANLNLAELNLLLPPAASAGIEALGRSLDTILQDPRLCPTLQPAVAILRVPLYKAALIEPHSIADAAHPVRRCLDALLALVYCVDPASTGAHPVVSAVSQYCRQCAREFDRDLAIFDELRSHFDGLLQRIEASTHSHAEPYFRPAESEAGREMARRVAAHTIRNLLTDAVPAPLHDFMEQFWLRVLAAIHMIHGQNSAQWQRGLETAHGLISSMEPKLTPEDRAGLVATLPSLLENVKQGLNLIGVPDKLREHLMQRFVAFHAAALHGRSNDDGATYPVPSMGAVRIDVPSALPNLRLLRLAPDGYAEQRTAPWAEALVVGDWLDVSLNGEQHLSAGGRLRIAAIVGDSRILVMAHPDKETVLIFPLRWLSDQGREGSAIGVPTRALLEGAAQAALLNM